MLWLALRLPLLPLEVFPQRPSPSAAIARERIVACDPLAESGGVVPGMRLADARALLPALAVQERDVERERRRLETLACWAGGFTSEVSLALPDALLLEVAGSLRFFGGLDALIPRIVNGIAEQGHVARVALAPTPRGALWLAAASIGNETAGDDVPFCLHMAELGNVLAPLPLDVLQFESAQVQRLSGFGARCVGDLLRLPRGGLARRLGVDFVTTLAQALGELPDPRERFRFPETFHESLELPARVEDAARLLFAVQRLVQVLCGWLAARSSGIAACRLWFEHERGRATVLELPFSTPTRDGERIVRILRERLERASLAAPVEGLTLLADAPEPLPGRAGGLFGDTAAAEGVMLLVERLQARLGKSSVHAVTVRPEHRPERASANVAPGHGRYAASPGPRPCWLLPMPQPLAELGGRPQRGGPLTLLAGPERIESGWWDAGEEKAVGDVRRDYFIALSSRHEWLWVYRNHDGWFLQGIFS